MSVKKNPINYFCHESRLLSGLHVLGIRQMPSEKKSDSNGMK
jgi:hypothetical protein